jgi:hypothetical protein
MPSGCTGGSRLTFDDGEDDLPGPDLSLRVDDGHPVSRSPEIVDEVGCVALRDDPHKREPHGEPFLDDHADVVACRKTRCIREVVDGVRYVLEDLPDRDDPDEDLDESQHRRDQFHAPRDEDDPHRAEGDVAYSGEEYGYRENNEREKLGIGRRDRDHC